MHLLRQTLAFSALAVLPLGLMVADTAKTSTATKKSTTTKRTKTASTKKGTTAARTPSRARQLQPTPERYKEIQQALASKGYLNGEPSGAWNQGSVDALRRFQQDQNIAASGKIDSLSLIALGLGPKRGPTPALPVHSDQKPETTPQAPSTSSPSTNSPSTN